MEGTWLDGTFFKVLEYIGNMQQYFIKQGRIVAMICFALSLGISAVKMALGAAELSKELTKTFIALATYFILVWAFPLAMNKLQGVTGDFAYNAMMKTGLDQNKKLSPQQADQFYNWLDDAGGKELWQTYATGDNGEGVKKALQLKLMNGKTGFISINKVAVLVVSTIKVLWVPQKLSLTNMLSLLPDFLILIVVIIVYVACLIMTIIQYLTATIEYTFLAAIGVFLLPFMLWDGTKFAFESLAGSVLKITMKLMLVTIAIYFAAIVNVDIMINMFLLRLNGGAVGTGLLDRVEFYLTVVFMSVFVMMIGTHAGGIAEFLTGGSPRLSFGEFAQAVTSAANAGRMAGAVTGGVAKAGGGAITGAAMAGKAALDNGMAAAKLGGGAGAFLKGAGSSLARSTGHALNDAGGKAMGAIANAPQSIGSAARKMAHVVSPYTPLSSEQAGSRLGEGGGGGGGGGGKENGGKPAPQPVSGGIAKPESLGDRYRANIDSGNYSSAATGKMKNGLDSLRSYGQDRLQFSRDRAPANFSAPATTGNGMAAAGIIKGNTISAGPQGSEKKEKQQGAGDKATGNDAPKNSDAS